MPASRPASPTPGALRQGLAVLGAIGALCLIASTFATIIRIQVGTTSKVPDFDTHLSGWNRHGPALLLLLHPVHRGRALVDLTDLVGAAGVVEDALGRRRLTGVNVRHNSDVPATI